MHELVTGYSNYYEQTTLLQPENLKINSFYCKHQIIIFTQVIQYMSSAEYKLLLYNVQIITIVDSRVSGSIDKTYCNKSCSAK